VQVKVRNYEIGQEVIYVCPYVRGGSGDAYIDEYNGAHPYWDGHAQLDQSTEEIARDGLSAKHLQWPMVGVVVTKDEYISALDDGDADYSSVETGEKGIFVKYLRHVWDHYK
jgi:hypothetical protein